METNKHHPVIWDSSFGVVNGSTGKLWELKYLTQTLEREFQNWSKPWEVIFKCQKLLLLAFHDRLSFLTWDRMITIEGDDGTVFCSKKTFTFIIKYEFRVTSTSWQFNNFSECKKRGRTVFFSFWFHPSPASSPSSSSSKAWASFLSLFYSSTLNEKRAKMRESAEAPFNISIRPYECSSPSTSSTLFLSPSHPPLSQQETCRKWGMRTFFRKGGIFAYQ